jgi:hypothetical protein
LSKESTPKPPNPDLGDIAQAATAADDLAKKTSAADRLAALEERVASIEPLLEQAQANAKLGTKLTDYVDDLRSEQVFFNRARYAIGCISLLVIIGLVALLALAIFHSSSPLLTAPPLAIAAVIIGLVSSIALMLNSFVKGVFRSTNERHADGFLPPALEQGLELMHKVLGKH